MAPALHEFRRQHTHEAREANDVNIVGLEPPRDFSLERRAIGIAFRLYDLGLDALFGRVDDPGRVGREQAGVADVVEVAVGHRDILDVGRREAELLELVGEGRGYAHAVGVAVAGLVVDGLRQAGVPDEVAPGMADQVAGDDQGPPFPKAPNIIMKMIGKRCLFIFCFF